MAWQPMDTAPMDGSRFLAWMDGSEWPEAIMWIADDSVPFCGYWAYCEQLLNDVSGGVTEGFVWQPISPPEPS